MNKYIKKIIIVASLVLALTACQTDEVDQEKPNEDTKIEDQINEEQEAVAKDFDELIASETNLEEIKNFIDKNIDKADSDTADKMILELVELQKGAQEEAINKFSGENSANIQDQINKAYEKAKSEFDKGYIFTGSNKYTLIDNIEDKNVAKDIEELFNKGYGLISGEGTYYPIIDYTMMEEDYSDNLGDMTSDYIDIMATELDEPTTVEEHLAIDIDELKDRVLEYEDFMKDYKGSPYVEDVKMPYMICVWKIVNPTAFDKMLNEDLSPSDELKELYESILEDDSYPASQEAVKGITEFINSKEGVVGSPDNMDDFYKASANIHKQVEEKVAELYLGE